MQTVTVTIRVTTGDSEDIQDLIDALQTLCRLMSNDDRGVDIVSTEEQS